MRAERVDDFLIEITQVTNAQFARFVAETGHVIFAQIAPDPADYRGIDPSLAQRGLLVFDVPAIFRNMCDIGQWWHGRVGADWRHPLGPESSIDGLETIRLFTSPMATARPTPPRPAKPYRRKRNGNRLRAADLPTLTSPRAMNRCPKVPCWKTIDEASFQSKTTSLTAGPAPRPSALSRRTATASST